MVLIHGVLVDGTLWDGAADRLAERGLRCYQPDLPLGSHRIPLGARADLSPRGVARLILEFLEALDLSSVTLVGNDTGGALCQFVLDTDASRIGRVVLTNCDAFDTFPPFPFDLVFRLMAGRARLAASLQPMRLRAVRHSPLGFGLLAGRFDPDQTRSWVEPCLTDRAIRDETVRFLRAIDPAELLEVSTGLSEYDGPVRLVWGTADRCFTPELGRRLQGAFGNAELVEVPGARTFVSLDAPEILAEQIAELSGSYSAS